MWYVKTKSVDEWGNVRNCNYEPAFKLTQDKYNNYYYKGRIVDKTTYDTSEDDYSSKFFFTKLRVTMLKLYTILLIGKILLLVNEQLEAPI